MLTFCAVCGHWQKGIAECHIGVIQQMAWTLLLHALKHWPTVITEDFWPYAVHHAINLHNTTIRHAVHRKAHGHCSQMKTVHGPLIFFEHLVVLYMSLTRNYKMVRILTNGKTELGKASMFVYQNIIQALWLGPTIQKAHTLHHNSMLSLMKLFQVFHKEINLLEWQSRNWIWFSILYLRMLVGYTLTNLLIVVIITTLIKKPGMKLPYYLPAPWSMDGNGKNAISHLFLTNHILRQAW